MNPSLIEHLVIFKTFFSITAHTRDAIKNDSIIFLYLGDELFPLRSVLSCTGEELSNNSGVGVDCGDVGNLSCNLLVLGADAAIGVNHMPKKRYFKFDPNVFNKLQADFELHSNMTDEDSMESEEEKTEVVVPRRKFEGFSF